MIDHATIERILEAAQIEQVVGEFVSLKRRGANYIACCPFHNEKTPSFSVSPSKGIYKCFGCGKAGNVVSFIMEHEQMTYVEALRFLANKYHITLDEQEETPQQAEMRLKRDSMLIVNSFAQQYYSNFLWEDPMGQNVGLSYFRQRGFSDSTIRQFQLGYSPNKRDAFTREALSQGYKLELLSATGLTLDYPAHDDKPAAILDRYQDRVIFPIHSLSGRVIAFGGRTLRTDKTLAKYINSPESEVYVKSKSLYGIYFAKQHITRLQKCYLVEGYTDVISLWQAGIQNVVASSGTSLTMDQIRLIKRFTPLVTVLYDGDDAGIKASIRGIDMLLEEGLQVKVVRFPATEDPDSFARTHGAQETMDFLDKNETDFIHFKISLMADQMRDPLNRSALIREVMQSIAIVPDAITRSVYVEECSRHLDIEESLLSREVAKIRKQRLAQRFAAETNVSTTSSGASPVLMAPGTEISSPSKSKKGLPSDLEQAEEDLTYYLLKFGQSPMEEGTVAEYITHSLETDQLELQNPFFKELFRLYASCEGDNAQRRRELINHPNPSVSQSVVDLLDQAHPLTVKALKDSLPSEELMLKEHVRKTVLVYKSRIVSLAYTSLTQQLKTAQQLGQADIMEQLINQMKNLLEVRKAFAKELNRLTT